MSLANAVRAPVPIVQDVKSFLAGLAIERVDDALERDVTAARIEDVGAHAGPQPPQRFGERRFARQIVRSDPVAPTP